ncbi:uncharacterized protein LOC111060503 isoform X2 [Nilaparvata lugens]|uniref:uncharacterized protein LOC111060503 isoform X2 n=1 Tax=Nilaparvata lugens TaxID=108931 RepID=UPI00193E0139|nr:uncharacterized protein LOC111060503 isoform X2 [Nilaparvata lugens]
MNYSEVVFNNETCDSTVQPTLSSMYFQSTVFVMYCGIFVAALLGNGLVCYVVSCSRRMHTVTNFFIVNLAVGDILMTLFCVPFSFVATLVLQYWPFGELLCHTVQFSQVTSVMVHMHRKLGIERVSECLFVSAADPAIRGAIFGAGIHLHENSRCGLGQTHSRRGTKLPRRSNGSLKEKDDQNDGHSCGCLHSLLAAFEHFFVGVGAKSRSVQLGVDAALFLRLPLAGDVAHLLQPDHLLLDEFALPHWLLLGAWPSLGSGCLVWSCKHLQHIPISAAPDRTLTHLSGGANLITEKYRGNRYIRPSLE